MFLVATEIRLLVEWTLSQHTGRQQYNSSMTNWHPNPTDWTLATYTCSQHTILMLLNRMPLQQAKGE